MKIIATKRISTIVNYNNRQQNHTVIHLKTFNKRLKSHLNQVINNINSSKNNKNLL